ncbi:DUF397 domain-containing protein [Streptomyces sp. NRRL F-5123]|uniref:DUF397 domain-containing protein n=1 Tax=Streptomyces sp. NRRL F-5123 TaxID=1463856 RepID=UPI0004E1AF92|nr:DUF397 domain-containing protein [Streptomyces sp. NRRL F-5123]
MRENWFKSSYSGQNGNCLETRLRDGMVGCRDSKDVAGPALSFEADQWQDFVDAVKTGHFSTPAA